MVIETFRKDCLDAAYARLATRGRLLPDGLGYIDSWLEENGNRCFQLMETDDPKRFDEWTNHWNDLVSFEIIKLGSKPGAK